MRTHFKSQHKRGPACGSRPSSPVLSSNASEVTCGMCLEVIKRADKARSRKRGDMGHIISDRQLKGMGS